MDAARRRRARPARAARPVVAGPSIAAMMPAGDAADSERGGAMAPPQVLVRVPAGPRARTQCLAGAPVGARAAADVLGEALRAAGAARMAPWALWDPARARWLEPADAVENGAWLEARLRGGLRGGKGGFGNTLRASARRGGQGTADFSACRDLNGRRLRHVNNEIRLRLWREEQALREQLRKENKDLAPGDSKLLNTPSGIKNWFLSVPSWADKSSKGRKAEATRGRRLCTDWARAQVTQAKRPDSAPPWFGCPRGRACPFSHRPEDLTPARRAEVLAESRREARAAINDNMRTFVEQMQQTEASMGSSILEGMRRSKQAAVQAKASAKSDAQAMEDDVNQDLDTLERGDRIQCLCGDLGVGDFGEVEGRAEFSTAIVPSVAVTDDSWYFEVSLAADPAGSLQIGCATELFEVAERSEDGVGDLAASWALDPVRGKFFDQGREFEALVNGAPLRDAPFVKAGCVIGCHLDVGKRQLYFTIDGQRVSIAGLNAAEPLHLLPITRSASFSSLSSLSSSSSSSSPPPPSLSSSSLSPTSRGEASGTHFFYPAISMDAGTFIRINMGERAFQCEPLDRRVHGLCGDANLRLLCAGSSFVSESGGPGEEGLDPASQEDEAVKTAAKSAPEPPKEHVPVHLDAVESVDELEALGLQALKQELEARNLKCGGSLEERAQRLFSVKGLKPEEIDAALRPSSRRKKRRRVA